MWKRREQREAPLVTGIFRRRSDFRLKFRKYLSLFDTNRFAWFFLGEIFNSDYLLFFIVFQSLHEHLGLHSVFLVRAQV